MTSNLAEIKDVKIYALNMLINEHKTPTEVSSILGIPPVVLIGWLHKKNTTTDQEVTLLKQEINRLLKEIYNLKGLNCY